MDYPMTIVRLSEEDGGGYLAFFPDLVGCMSDGETPEEAVSNAQLAFLEWMDAAKERGIAAPAPYSAAARDKQERDEIFASIRDVIANQADIDDRLAALEKRMAEIEDHVANSESWARFHVIAPAIIVPGKRIVPLAH